MRYFLCAAPRTRNTFLGKMLEQDRNCGSFALWDGESILNFLLEFRRLDIDLAGFRLMYQDFIRILPSIDIHVHRYIYLYRENKVKQSISLAKALILDSFIQKADDVVDESPLDDVRQGELFKQIDTILIHLIKIDTGWQMFFQEHRLQPLSISYEMLEAPMDQYKVLLDIYCFLGIQGKPAPEDLALAINSINRSASEWNDRIYAAYMEQSDTADPKNW